MAATKPENEAPLPPLVRRLGWVSFFTDAATEMLYPLVPIFLTVTLGAPVAAVGVVEGLADGISTGMKAVAGYISDRVHRNRLLLTIGYTVSAFSKPVLALAPAWWFVALTRVTDRLGKAVRGVPRDVMIADAVSPEQRGRAFGLHRAMDTAGAVVGPLIAAAALLVVGPRNLRPVFLLAFIPGLATVALLTRLPRNDHVAGAGTWRGSSLPWRSRFGGYAAVLALFSLVNSSDAFLLLRAKNLGLSTIQVILAYALYNLTYALASLPAGIRADRRGRLRVFRSGLFVFALVYLGFAVAPGAWAVWPLLAVYGLYMAFTDGIGRAVVLDMVPDDVRGRAMGVTQAIMGFGVLVAGVTAGFLWDAVSPAAPFVVGAVGALAAWVLLAAVAAKPAQVA
ncbi:MAG TPA: MFS transporter [Acidimicrobiales bacterium]|nr:MFS transporter [Acidimicrobiales bacterium]